MAKQFPKGNRKKIAERVLALCENWTNIRSAKHYTTSLGRKEAKKAMYQYVLLNYGEKPKGFISSWLFMILIKLVATWVINELLDNWTGERA